MGSPKRKVFILDTNVLVFNPHCIETLGDNYIIVPIWATEELDRIHKKHPYEQVGYDAREASRQLDEYRKLGSLAKGVPTKSGGVLIVDYNGNDFNALPIGLERSTDNRILLIAKAWQDSMPKRPQQKGAKAMNKLPDLPAFEEVWLITKDTNLRIKANACGISVEDYLHDKIIKDIDLLYTGIREDKLPEDMAELLDGRNAIWTDHRIPAGLVLSKVGSEPLHNQCCRLVICETTLATVYKKDKGYFEIVNKQSITGGGLTPINAEQWLAYSLAMDPDIALLTIGGKAGSGKTIMALLAGWHQVKTERYKKMIVYRPMDSLGKDAGFLPGDLEEKFQPWTLPITDNMGLILNKDPDTQKDKEHKHSNPVREMMFSGLLEISPITHLTGRSIHNVYVVVDETQNLTPHQAGIIASRAGDGSKIVFTGDPKQITSGQGQVDQISNGFVYTAEMMKDLYLTGHVTLVKGERSPLADLVASRMLL